MSFGASGTNAEHPDNRELLNKIEILPDYEAAACISIGYGTETPQLTSRSSDRVKIIE